MNICYVILCLAVFWILAAVFVFSLCRSAKQKATVYVPIYDGHSIRETKGALFATPLEARAAAIALGYSPSQVTTIAIEVEI